MAPALTIIVLIIAVFAIAVVVSNYSGIQDSLQQWSSSQGMAFSWGPLGGMRSVNNPLSKNPTAKSSEGSGGREGSGGEGKEGLPVSEGPPAGEGTCKGKACGGREGITRTTTTSVPATTTVTPTTPGFAYTSLNCNSSSKVCSISYSNNLGESAVVVLYLLNGQNLIQQSAIGVPTGSGSFNAPPFSCGPLPSGQYVIFFQVFRNSDNTYSNPVLSPAESRTVTCP